MSAAASDSTRKGIVIVRHMVPSAYWMVWSAAVRNEREDTRRVLAGEPLPWDPVLRPDGELPLPADDAEVFWPGGRYAP